jgi:hypothetical protein
MADWLPRKEQTQMIRLRLVLFLYPFADNPIPHGLGDVR